MMLRSPSSRALGAMILGALVTGCTVGAPPGFSSGDSWSFPLVGPLEDGPLLVPVMINDTGPYLFLLDPDAPMTSIDEALAAKLDLIGGLGGRLSDETDTERPVRVAEFSSLTLGSLTVRRRLVALHRNGAFAAAGRPLQGIIGRNILAESLVFAFDRDAGMGYLATRDVFTAPAGATAVPFRDIALGSQVGDVNGATRRLVKATINGTSYDVHVDLGGYQSQLRASLWPQARLTPLPYRATLVDELGTTRSVDKAGIANQIAVGGASGMGVLMVPYGDLRTDPEAVDGTVGLNFFAPYAVWADWSGRTIYVRPRETDEDKVALRLSRWASRELIACRQPACVVKAAVAGPPPPPPGSEDEPPPVDLEVTRDASVEGLAYEVTLDATGADGRALGLPRLIATFPRGVTTIRQKVSPMFAGATLRVVDVSPFVRPCPTAAGCVLELALAR